MQRLRIAAAKGRKPTQKLTLSAASIAAIKPPATGRDVIYDTKVLGLCVRVTSNGSKAFYVYRWSAGRPHWLRLGGCGEITVDNARAAAKKAVADYSQGVDPQAVKAAAREEMTLGELWKAYLERHAKPHKRSWEDDLSLWNSPLSRYSAHRLSHVDVATVAKWHNQIGSYAPVRANRALSLLSGMIAFARSHLGFKGENPCGDVKRFPESSRERFLEPSELKPFFAALENEPDPLMKDFFYVLLLTGARRNNVLAMKWEDVDVDGARWIIPAASSKNKKPLILYLSAECIKILRRRRRKVSKATPWVFPSWGNTGHLVEPKKPWLALLKRAGIKDLWLHDLRRTLGSWQAAQGTSLAIIGKSLGHASPDATQIYARLNMDPVKVSVDAATKAMLKYRKRSKSSES